MGTIAKTLIIAILVGGLSIQLKAQTSTRVKVPVQAEEFTQWSQWAGSAKDFTAGDQELAQSWSEAGPKQIWSRPLGEGYSSISVVGGRLYTMYRSDDSEVVICMNAKTGETVWEHPYKSETTRAMRQYGRGPHSTPLVTDRLVITIGINLVVHALDINTGEVVWRHDLVNDYGARVPFRGYAPSPTRDGEVVYFATDMPANPEVEPGSEDSTNHALVAFRITDGKLLWTGLKGVTAYSSPVIKELAGRKQIILLMRKFVAAADPETGEELWRSPVIEGHNVATPLCHENQIFVTAAYESGSKLIEVESSDDNHQLAAKERWHTRDIRFDQGNAIWLGKHLYATSGDSGPAFLTCFDTVTGKPVWRERGFRRSTLVQAGDNTVMLQEDGTLRLLQLSPKGPSVLATHKIEIKKRPLWTPPTLVNSILYVRSRTHLMAYDLRPVAESED